jgi:hypothetical protein
MLGFLDVPVRSRAETGNNPGNWDPIDIAVRGKWFHLSSYRQFPDLDSEALRRVYRSFHKADTDVEGPPRIWAAYWLRGRASYSQESAHRILMLMDERMRNGPAEERNKWFVVMVETFYRDNMTFPGQLSINWGLPTDWAAVWNIGGNPDTIADLVNRNEARNYNPNAPNLPAAQKWPSILESMKRITRDYRRK